MRVISQSELLRATKFELQVLLREITASLAVSRGRLARTADCPLQPAQYPSCHGKTGAQAALSGPAGAAPPAGLCRLLLAVLSRLGNLAEQILEL